MDDSVRDRRDEQRWHCFLHRFRLGSGENTLEELWHCMLINIRKGGYVCCSGDHLHGSRRRRDPTMFFFQSFFLSSVFGFCRLRRISECQECLKQCCQGGTCFLNANKGRVILSTDRLFLRNTLFTGFYASSLHTYAISTRVNQRNKSRRKFPHFFGSMYVRKRERSHSFNEHDSPS